MGSAGRRRVGRAGALVALLAASATAGTLVRGPYLQRAAPTEVTVRWRTAAAEESVVRFGPGPSALTTSVRLPGAVSEHVVRLAGLDPDTRYYYSIGTLAETLAGGDADHHFTTAPLPGAVRPFTAWVIGDSGTANADAARVRDAYLAYIGTRSTDLWLMLGDNAYLSGTDAEYQKAVFDMYPRVLRSTVLWPTIGNHDAVSAQSASQSGPYFDVFTLPGAAQAGGLPSGTEAYYSFDHGNVHFICLDSYGSDRSPGAAMLTWLGADLAATTADWVVAFWHAPPYSKGTHNSDSETELVQMRQNAVPILEDGGADLILCGHSHSYERSFLIDGHYGKARTFQAAMKIDATSGDPDGSGPYRKPAGGPVPHAGAVYAVSGSSGLLEPGGNLDHPAMYVSLRELGSMVLEVNAGRLDATFLEADGTIGDHFAIFKGTGVPPRGPIDLAAAALSATEIRLDWVDRASGEEGYELLRSQDGIAFASVALLPADTATYRDTGLFAATTYQYRVRATSPFGPSAESNVAAATTADCPPVASVGNTFRLTRGAAAIGATWTDVAGADRYRLYSDPAPGGGFLTPAGTAPSGIPGLLIADPALALVLYRVAGANDCREGAR